MPSIDFDHGAFFAADVGARAASQVYLGMRGKTRRLEFGQLRREDLAYGWILISHVEEDFSGLDRPGGDQHAFEKPVRLAFEIVAILEGAGLTLITIDGHQARTRLRPYEAPFSAGREAGASKAAQASIRERCNHAVRRALAAQAGL